MNEMTSLLVKLFIKDSENLEDPQVRTAYGILSSMAGILCNVILFIIKLIIGLMMNSISVMADAFNNLSDAASGVISFVGVKLASRPADKEHPFGHGRYEYIAAFVVSFLVLEVGFTCMKSSFSKIRNPEEVGFYPVLIGILAVSMLIKLWLGCFNRKLGKKINSGVMKATSADSFGDVLITLVTILSIFIGKWTGLRVDGFMGVAVSLFVLYAGFTIAKETLEPLIGPAVTPELYQQITEFVEKYDGIVGTHDLIAHNYGPSTIMATIHGEVPKDSDIEKAHETIDAIERDALRELGIFLIIHMDPIEVNNERILALKTVVTKIVEEHESEASIHDFRVVNGEEHINLIFDLVVPHKYKKDKEEKLIEGILKAVQEKDDRYQCIITLEHSFVNANSR